MYLSKHERNRRYEQLRKIMAKDGIDVLLVVGNNHYTASPLFSTGNFRYLTDFFIFSLYGLLLFFRESDPIMLVPMELQETFAQKYSWINDIRISPDYADTVTLILEEKNLSKGNIGIVSMESLPAATYLSLRKTLPKANFFDAPSILLPMRFVKTRGRKTAAEESGRIERRRIQRSPEPAATRDERIRSRRHPRRISPGERCGQDLQPRFFRVVPCDQRRNRLPGSALVPGPT